MVQPSTAEIVAYLDTLTERCGRIRSVWMVDHGWQTGSELILFADDLVLRYLGQSADLLHPAISLLIVTETGEVYRPTIGERCGSLREWGWAEGYDGLSSYVEPGARKRYCCQVRRNG